MDRNLEKSSKNEISREITVKFLDLLEKIVAEGWVEGISSEAKLMAMLQIKQNYISKIKANPRRYVTIDMISSFVNELGVNSNILFVLNEKEAKKEKVIREGFTINQGRSGNTNNISNNRGNLVQGPVVNGDNHKGDINTTLKILKGLTPKDRREMKEYYESITNKNELLINQVGDLKKTLAQHEKAMKAKNIELKKKEDEFSELSKKYITLLETKVKGK